MEKTLGMGDDSQNDKSFTALLATLATPRTSMVPQSNKAER